MTYYIRYNTDRKRFEVKWGIKSTYYNTPHAFIQRALKFRQQEGHEVRFMPYRKKKVAT